MLSQGRSEDDDLWTETACHESHGQRAMEHESGLSDFGPTGAMPPATLVARSRSRQRLRDVEDASYALLLYSLGGLPVQRRKAREKLL